MKKTLPEINVNTQLPISSRTLVENVISDAKEVDIIWPEKQITSAYPKSDKKIAKDRQDTDE